MSNKKKDDEDMNLTLSQKQTNKKKKILESFDKVVKLNGKALEKLSKN